MQNTVFYAWQSDLPNKTNRQLIRDALDDAIKTLNANLHVDEALRVDQDTAGVPGNPTIAEVIFKKIDECRVFVPDITTITPPGVKRPAPNPNVLIEYGRATVKPGDDCVITVFNEAYGDWERDRPFDMKHKRKPCLYNLAEQHTPEERRRSRIALGRQLADRIKAVLAVPRPESRQLPDASEFAASRELYFRLRPGKQPHGRFAGFWIGLIPRGVGVLLEDPYSWLRSIDRKKRLRATFLRGGSSLEFEAIDGKFREVVENIAPVLKGARRTWRAAFTVDNRVPAEDLVALHVHEQLKHPLIL